MEITLNKDLFLLIEFTKSEEKNNNYNFTNKCIYICLLSKRYRNMKKFCLNFILTLLVYFAKTRHCLKLSRMTQIFIFNKVIFQSVHFSIAQLND